jgi:hypothetical protein
VLNTRPYQHFGISCNGEPPTLGLATLDLTKALPKSGRKKTDALGASVFLLWARCASEKKKGRQSNQRPKSREETPKKG